MELSSLILLVWKVFAFTRMELSSFVHVEAFSFTRMELSLFAHLLVWRHSVQSPLPASN